MPKPNWEEQDLEANLHKLEDSEEYLLKVNDELERLQQRKAEIQSELHSDTEEKPGLRDELQAVESKINKYNQEKISALETRNNSFKKEIQRKSQQIVSEWEEEKKEIEESKEKLQELQDTASGLLEKSTGAALGHQFADRKEEMEEPLYYWKISAAATIVALMAASVVIFVDITINGGNVTTNVSKVALLLPISVAVWFTVSNYNRQKRLMEEYEFKSRIALSLEGFNEKLDSEISEEQEDVKVAFLVNAMEQIYTNPQSNITDESSEEDASVSNQTALVDYVLNR